MDTARYDLLKLENQLCFPLYAVSREVIKLYKSFLDELDLTYTQYIAMILLWEYGSMTVKEIGERLFLDSGTLTPLLKKLEAKGYITRTRSTKDERNLIVTMTEVGEAVKDKARGMILSMDNRCPLTTEEAVTLYKLLYKGLGEPDADAPDWACDGQ